MNLVSVVLAVVLLGLTTAGIVQYSNSVGQERREMNTRVQEDAYRVFQSELALSAPSATGPTANPLAHAVSGLGSNPNATFASSAALGRNLTGSADIIGYTATSDASGRSTALGYVISSTGSAVAAPVAVALSPPSFRVSGVVPESEVSPGLSNLILAAAGNPAGTVYRYTTDGSDPTATSPIWITATSTLSADPLPSLIKTAAFNSDPQFSASPTVLTNLSRQLSIVYARSGGGSSTSFTYAEITGATNPIVLSVSNAPAGTRIYFTYDGSNPSAASTSYSSPFHVPLGSWSSTVSLKAYAETGSNNITTPVLSVTLTPLVTTLPQPTLSTGGSSSAVEVAMTSSVPGSIIRYAIDAAVDSTSPTVSSGESITVRAP